MKGQAIGEFHQNRLFELVRLYSNTPFLQLKTPPKLSREILDNGIDGLEFVVVSNRSLRRLEKARERICSSANPSMDEVVENLDDKVVFLKELRDLLADIGEVHSGTEFPQSAMFAPCVADFALWASEYGNSELSDSVETRYVIAKTVNQFLNSWTEEYLQANVLEGLNELKSLIQELNSSCALLYTRQSPSNLFDRFKIEFVSEDDRAATRKCHLLVRDWEAGNLELLKFLQELRNYLFSIEYLTEDRWDQVHESLQVLYLTVDGTNRASKRAGDLNEGELENLALALKQIKMQLSGK